MGHADRLHLETLDKIKFKYPDLKIAEWNVDNYKLDNTENKLRRSRYLDGMFSTTSDNQLSECLNENFITFFPNIDISIENLKIFQSIYHEKDIFCIVTWCWYRKLKKNSIKNDQRVMFANKIIKANRLIVIFGLNNIQPVWASDFDNEIKKYCRTYITKKTSIKPIAFQIEFLNMVEMDLCYSSKEKLNIMNF